MKSGSFWIVTLLIALAAGGGGYWYGKHHAAADAHGDDDTERGSATTLPAGEAEDKPVVPVEVIPLKHGVISETVKAYGSVIAEAGNVQSQSVPFEARVVRVLVTPGQSVEPGAELIQLEASADALIALQEAKNAVEGATNDLKQVQQRFADHLATNQELSTAQQALQTAKLKRQSLTERGVGESNTLKAKSAGIVSKVDVQEGQIISAGAPLVELAMGNRLEVRLGVEPADAQALKVGQPVKLRRIDGVAPAEAIEGRIRSIGRRVDPATRMLDVLVSLPDNANLLLDSFIVAELTRASADALIIPREAALPGENAEATIFTVRDGKAAKHAVHLGLQNDQEVQVIANDLKPAESVVVSGNYLLEDGMAVEVKDAAAAPAAATEPATAPAGGVEAKP
jgi:membrane fusion protein (multidrug efflux system)